MRDREREKCCLRVEQHGETEMETLPQGHGNSLLEGAIQLHRHVQKSADLCVHVPLDLERDQTGRQRHSHRDTQTERHKERTRVAERDPEEH